MNDREVRPAGEVAQNGAVAMESAHNFSIFACETLAKKMDKISWRVSEPRHTCWELPRSYAEDVDVDHVSSLPSVQVLRKLGTLEKNGADDTHEGQWTDNRNWW